MERRSEGVRPRLRRTSVAASWAPRVQPSPRPAPLPVPTPPAVGLAARRRAGPATKHAPDRLSVLRPRARPGPNSRRALGFASHLRCPSRLVLADPEKRKNPRPDTRPSVHAGSPRSADGLRTENARRNAGGVPPLTPKTRAGPPPTWPSGDQRARARLPRYPGRAGWQRGGGALWVSAGAPRESRQGEERKSGGALTASGMRLLGSFVPPGLLSLALANWWGRMVSQARPQTSRRCTRGGRRDPGRSARKENTGGAPRQVSQAAQPAHPHPSPPSPPTLPPPPTPLCPRTASGMRLLGSFVPPGLLSLALANWWGRMVSQARPQTSRRCTRGGRRDPGRSATKENVGGAPRRFVAHARSTVLTLAHPQPSSRTPPSAARPGMPVQPQRR